MSDRDIAIVGMACVLPKAANMGEYWSNIVNGVNAIEEMPPDRWTSWNNLNLPKNHEAHIPSSRGGFIPSNFRFDPLEFGIMPNIVRNGDPDQFLMLQVVVDALADADVGRDDAIRERTDLIIGRGGYFSDKHVELALRVQGIDLILELIERKYPDLMKPVGRDAIDAYLRSVMPPNETDSISTTIPNIAASRAANRLNLRGDAYTVDAACASSLVALEQVVDRLRTGKCDLGIAAGIFLHQMPSFWFVFTRLGAISPDGMLRPFDRRANGLVIGEGAGAVVLKRMDDAIRDGDRVYAVLKGIGSASDGRDVDVLAPSSQGQILALKRAYEDAGISSDSIGYLETHGTGTNAGDQAEIASIKKFFGTSSLPPTARAMGSVKSMIGHLMPASGIASLIRVALSLSNKILPPSLHCEEPLEQLDDAPFYFNTETRPWVHNEGSGPRRAGINTFGFGGINVHVVLEEVPKPAATSAKALRPRPMVLELQRETELIVFSAADLPELRNRLVRLEQFLDRDETDPRLVDISWSLSRELDFALPYKLAFVCESVEKLRTLLKQCHATLSSDNPDFEEAETIYYSPDAEHHTGKIVFIFPGMGFPGLIGNYPDHLLELCLHFPEVRAEFDFFEARDRHPEDLIPTSSIFCPPAILPEAFRMKLKQRLAPPKLDKQNVVELRPEERYLAAMGVTLANWLGWVLLKKLQIPVQMMAGQSQGEMAALCASGISDFHESAPRFWKMLNMNPRYSADQRLCFAWATAEKIEPIIAEYPGTYLAIYMAPEAVIFGGEEKVLEEIADRLRSEQILVQVLPYPPIHTPCLSYLRDEINQDIDDDFEMNEPQVELYSSILADKYPEDPLLIRETLMLNLDHPLRVWQTIRKIFDDGGRIFVQVGGGHMAAHMKMLLPEGTKVITAALDSDTKDAITQLNILCATLVGAGVPLELSALYEHRTINTLDFDDPQSAPLEARTAMPLRMDWEPFKHPGVPPRSDAISSGAERQEAATPDVSDAVPAADHVESARTTVDQSEAHMPQPVSAMDVVSEEPMATADQSSDVSAEYESTERSDEPRLPLLGTVTHFEPGVEIRMERKLSLKEDVYLKDHLFVHAAEVKPLEECLPIMPMTMSIELLAETASQLAPGLGLIGFENIRASRWIGLQDCVETDIWMEGRVLSHDPETGVIRIDTAVHFDGKKSASATVLFAEHYREDLQIEVADDSHEPVWPYPVEEVYGDRRMFHGPSFHVVSGLTRFGNPCCSGTLRVLPKNELFRSTTNPVLLTDPCLNDGVGQMVGLWCHVHGWYVLPTGVDKIEIYGPTPPVGTDAPIRIEVTTFDLELKQIRCNIVVEDGQGYVWMRMQGWSDWIFKWPQRFTEFSRIPTRFFMGDELVLPGQDEQTVCVVSDALDLKKVDQNWAMRVILHSNEVPEYRDLADSKTSYRFLAARCAIKDAARIWWARRYGTDFPHTAEFEVGHDALGRPFLAPNGDPNLPKISLSHSGDSLVAVASEVDVGIDIEPIDRDTRAILPDFATPEEIALLDEFAARAPDQIWETRLWCAKEAASKALGKGLQGRPKNYKLIDLDEKGGCLIHDIESGIRCVVGTYLINGLVVAHAIVAASVEIEG